MEINAITLGKSCCPKPKSIMFEGKKAALNTSLNSRQLAQKVLDELEHLHSDINMITFSNAIDARIRVAKEAKERLGGLKQFFAALTARSLKR